MPPPTAKYQFSIFEYNTSTNNSAATKAVIDCSELFTQKGYQNHTLTFYNNSKRGFKFYSAAFFGICKFLWKIKRGALVGTQYPMLNNVFKYFIILSRLKGIKFFCVIHDIESLRLGGKDKVAVSAEIGNLNYYRGIIVHNDNMRQWLVDNGVNTIMVSLTIFDYLADIRQTDPGPNLSNYIVYAGNLAKSSFVNSLGDITKWNFNLYGPNFLPKGNSENVRWGGEFSSLQIVNEIKGNFGLIWDGDSIDIIDDVLGNYLKYNNPHKFSLYVAAGLPVIVPASAAIAVIVKKYEIGILINNLYDLQSISIDHIAYKEMKANLVHLQKKVIEGHYFSAALDIIEKQLLN